MQGHFAKKKQQNKKYNFDIAAEDLSLRMYIF